MDCCKTNPRILCNICREVAYCSLRCRGADPHGAFCARLARELAGYERVLTVSNAMWDDPFCRWSIYSFAHYKIMNAGATRVDCEVGDEFVTVFPRTGGMLPANTICIRFHMARGNGQRTIIMTAGVSGDKWACDKLVFAIKK